MNEKNKLTVKEADAKDEDSVVARIDYDSMDSLGVSSYDVIEVKGKRRTVAWCRPPRYSAIEKGIIRLGELVRNNAGIAIGDTVTIGKIVAPKAEKVVVVPVGAIPSIEGRDLADALREYVPVMKGDNVMLSYSRGRLTFQVIGFMPAADAVRITEKTVFSIAHINFSFNDIVKQETSEDNYLILKVHLYHGGFEALVEFQRKLEKNAILKNLVSRYEELAKESVAVANRKLAESSNVNSADLINGIKSEILEKWRTVS